MELTDVNVVMDKVNRERQHESPFLMCGHLVAGPETAKWK
jgi:hypothetical protein